MRKYELGAHVEPRMREVGQSVELTVAPATLKLIGQPLGPAIAPKK